MNDTLEAAAAAGLAASAASKATYGGSIAVVGGWLFSSEAAIVVGMLIGIAGLVVQWYYKRAEYQLRLREHHHVMGSKQVTTDTEV